LLGAEAEGLHPGLMVAFALGFALFMLTIGRLLVRMAMPWVLAFTSWPGGVIGFATLGAFLCAALTEWIGIHALFGAFFWGIALGDTPHFRKDTRRILDGFIAFVFAPVFFATIGLRVDFVAHFDLNLVAVVLGVACLGKIAGAGLGAKLSGMSWRESTAVGFAMNARGAMEIVLGLTALQQGLIDERIFVALVVMALVTSMISGPVMQRLMRRGRQWSFTDWVTVDTFVSPLEVRSAAEAIKRLSHVTAAAAGLPGDSVEEAVLAREAMMPTGLAHGIAVPHARISGLTRPWVGIGVLADGADFGALDDQPARLVILLLTPEDDRSAIQLELLADIAAAFHDETAAAYAKDAKSLTELLAAVRTAERPGGAHR
jgi:mannitol/fructose-specific phosphotransferase system IIA component (Ntr-type)